MRTKGSQSRNWVIKHLVLIGSIVHCPPTWSYYFQNKHTTSQLNDNGGYASILFISLLPELQSGKLMSWNSLLTVLCALLRTSHWAILTPVTRCRAGEGGGWPLTVKPEWEFRCSWEGVFSCQCCPHSPNCDWVTRQLYQCYEDEQEHRGENIYSGSKSH